jgi:hypothetical protein
MKILKHGEQGCPGCELLEGMLEESEARFFEKIRYIKVLESALCRICDEVGQHDTDNVDAEKLQASITEVHCICMAAMPELDPDHEPEKRLKTYTSERGYQLAYVHSPRDKPMLTCELAGKWYRLYLVMPDGTVRVADLSDIEDFAEPGETAVADHYWNPTVLWRLAKARGWHHDVVSEELIIGRWADNRNLL